jgi:hypothetical protein
MSAQPLPPSTPDTAAPGPGAPPRFDRKFIEDNRLLERYLEGKLPFKGARELETWCRAHPEYLAELKLSERTHASLKLLEHSGQPQDLGEPAIPWWKTIYFLIGLGVVTLASLVAFWVLFGKFVILRGSLEDTRTELTRGSMVAPVAQRNLRVAPDRGPHINAAVVSVNHSHPELIELRIDMSYSQLAQFRVTIDKRDQARALTITNLSKDSNGDLKLAFNTSGLGAGAYDVRIDGLPFRGDPIGEGWLVLDVR